MAKLQGCIELFLFGTICMSAIFMQSHLFTDTYIVPKWLCAISIILGMGLYCSIRLLFARPIKMNVSLAGIGIVIICLLQAIYGLLQYFDLFSSHSIYKVIGSFDNPAGFAACLCAGLPFVGFLLLDKNKYIRYAGWIAGIIIIVAVIMSHSRAGMVSVAVLSCMFLYEKLVNIRMLKYLLLIGLALLLVGCYWMKKDSADGRLLIWRCGMEMTKEALWLGHGVGSFEAHYMDYQSAYFAQQNGHSRYAMLADNVKQPFNEYLNILLNFGIMGLLVLLAMIVTLIYCYKKKPNDRKKIAFYALISIATFSCFSYPFTYPFTWIVTFLCIFVMTSEYLKQFLSVTWAKNAVCTSVLLCSLVGIYLLAERVWAEKEWNKASVLALCGSYTEALPTYEKLEKVLADNPYFLYNYAAILMENKQYEESLEIALKCRRYWADYDLELIIGENYQYLKNPERAEAYYNNASMMCPSRFLPLYKLFYLYKETDEEQRMLHVAETIINKPMKIKTPTILMMKRKMKREKLQVLNKI